MPGVAGKFALDIDRTTRIGEELHHFWAILDDIRFGSGFRFGTGVTGAAMMATLLLYPLRKVLSRKSGLGKVRRWFRLHIVFGLAGPAHYSLSLQFRPRRRERESRAMVDASDCWEWISWSIRPHTSQCALSRRDHASAVSL